MKTPITVLAIFLFATQTSYGQAIDRFGINIGVPYATQVWTHKNGNFHHDIGYKIGFMSFLRVEKDLSSRFTLRTELGYVQKGFKNKLEFTDSNGESLGVKNDDVILHELAFNLGLKIRPFENFSLPYLHAGLQSEYLIAYKDITVNVSGSEMEFGFYESTLSDLNEFNVGVLAGLGINLNERFYFEIEYNPNITKSFESDNLEIRDMAWGAKIGVNLNKMGER